MRKAVTDGAAVELNLRDFNAENLKAKVLEVVQNPAYRENMQKRSKKFNDQPMQPLDRAIWWIEYVLRNPEPVHLLSPAINMSFLAAYSLDLLIFLFIFITVVLVLVLRKILKCNCKNGSKMKMN